MNLRDKLTAIRDAVQQDVGSRGLRTDPRDNLISATLFDFPEACRTFTNLQKASVAVVTGFVIPTAEPPRAETDGPLGAVFLARVLTSMGVRVYLVSDRYGAAALKAGVEATGLTGKASVVTLPMEMTEEDLSLYRKSVGPLTHLIALERVGPSHTPASIAQQLEGTSLMVDRYRREVPADHHDRCHTMRGRDISDLTAPLHLLFEADDPKLAEVTIGIGDGGNEIGMGKVGWDTVNRNVPDGGKVACRVPTDYLIVAGVSNWGAYALGAGAALVRGHPLDAGLFDPVSEQDLLRVMVEKGPLVDGVTGEPTATVDGLAFDEYVKPLVRIGEIVRS